MPAASASASAAASKEDGGLTVATGDASQASTVQKLPPQVVEEALIISEMFNLNEIAALQLLLKGGREIGTWQRSKGPFAH